MSSKPQDKKPVKKKKIDWSTYDPSEKFITWCSPITDRSYGYIKAVDVRDMLVRHKLADKVIPIVEGGIQPVDENGPCGRFQTTTHEYESNTEEYLELRNLCMGRPKEYRPPADKPQVITQNYIVGKSRGAPE